MKKIALITASIIALLTLTACGTKPFESDVDEFTFTETDTIHLMDGDTEIYTYTFEDELKLFVNEAEDIYNFKNINNYKVASDNIIAFMESFGDNVSYRTTQLNFANKVELSLGATEDDYNTENFEYTGNVYSKDAFMTDDTGVTVILSYTEFSIDGEKIVVPSFIQLFVNVIHIEESWEYLDASNEYMDESAKRITYSHIVVPLPMKTGVKSSFDELSSTGTLVDDFTRVVASNTSNTGTWTACTDEQETECIDPQSTTLEVQIYEMDEDDVIEFYEQNFGGVQNGDEFVFVLNGNTFVLYNIEVVQVKDDSGTVITVTNANIKLK